jgi:hypothetical protein
MLVQQRPEACDTLTAHKGANVNSVKIEFGKEATTLIAILLLALGGCGVIMGMNLSRQAQQDEDFKAMKTQQWLLERRLMDKEAIDILHGDRLESDREYGPTGNLQRMKPKEK